jgi:CheY-like chemotaxis protein
MAGLKPTALSIFRSNGELLHYTLRSAHLHTPQARRAAVRIAVIDDEAFAPQNNLQNYGYKITPVGDLKSVNEVEAYDMILCDIVGVGRNFDSVAQGASLIAEIKKNYPEKVVVAYTGGALTERSSRMAADRADAMIKKDADIEEWINQLDKLSADAVDPHVIWNKIRSRFVELDVDSKQILLLEDAYVGSIKARDPELTALKKIASTGGLGADVRAIVQGLISSAIFKVIVG